jgi:hypothetical protein
MHLVATNINIEQGGSKPIAESREVSESLKKTKSEEVEVSTRNQEDTWATYQLQEKYGKAIKELGNLKDKVRKAREVCDIY